VVKQVRYCDFEFDILREFVSAELFIAIFSIVAFEEEMSCRLVRGYEKLRDSPSMPSASWVERFLLLCVDFCLVR